MIKDRLVSLINQYVGQFVENINQDNLNYSVLGGNVELKDLVLKPNALVDFLTLQLGKEQAFDVKVGHLDYIRLSIPWANLFGGTEVRLELDGLYLLLSPVSVNVANKQRVEELEQKLKQAMLRALDPSVLQKVSKEVEKHPGLFEKIGKYILNNIQIKISNVHIRYEDSISNPASPFAAGGILGGLYIFTTNDRWEEAELDSTAKILHKLGRVSDLSVYWNPRVDNSDLVGGVDLIQSGAWKTSLKKSIRSKMIKSEKFSSVLTPFTAEAKVILYNVDDYKMPKLYIQLSVDNADVRMSRNQYDSLTRWLEFSKLLEVNRRYRKFRPMKSVKSSPASWWKYAYKSVVEFYIKPYTWPQIVKYKQDYEKYWNLYKQYLASLKDDNIKQKLEGLEKVMDVANILKARAQAKVKYTEEMKERERLKKEEMKRKKEEKKKTGGGWFSWIWGGSEEEEELDDLATEEELFALSEEEKQEIYQGVGYSESENAQSMPKEYVAYKIQLRVRQCCGCLTRSEAPDSVCILQVVMDDMLTSYENRPGGQGVRVVSNTESFVISGISVDQKPVKMLTSNGGIYTSDLTGQMFTLEYELRPLHIKAEQSLKMTVRPVEIFYDQHSISEIFGFFQSSDHTGDTDMNALAMEKLSGVVKYSKDMLLYAMQQQSTFYVAIHMRSPYVVIPENGTLHKGGNVLVVDFGTLSVESDLQEKPDPKASMSSSPLQNQMYDKFLVKVSDVKALIADSGEDWPQFQTQVNSRFHVLPSTHLTISFYKTIVPDNYQIPHQKFDVLLPSLTLNLNDDQILVLYNFLFHFPSPSRVAWGAETARDGGELSRPRLVLADVQLDPDISTLRAIRKSILRRSVARGRLTVVEEGVPSKSALPPIQSAEDLKSMEDPSFPVMEDMDDEDGDWKSDTNIRSVEDYLTERVKMRIYLRLQIAEMVLQISQKSEGRDYLMFRLDRISADMAVLDYVQDSQTPSQCGMAAVASVGALSLADKLHTGTSGAYLELLRTESDKELITFSYRQINTKCPDFEPVFESTENKATLMCNSLTIRLDQTGTCYLKKFLQQLQDRIAENEKKRAGFPSDVIDAVPVRRRGSKDASSITSRTLSQITQRITTFVDEVDAEMGRAAVQKQTLIKFHLTSHVQKVTIHLSNLDHPVAEMELIGMDTQISVENKKACYRSQIKDLAVLDKTAGTLYPHILMLEEKDSPFFSMKVVQFWHSSKKRGKGRAGDQGLDYKVHLKIGDLQLAYVNRFLWDITKFFEPLKTPEIVEAAAATMENVSKQVAEIQPSSVRVGLVIDMKTPTVIVPKTSKSPDLLLFRFDYLQIRNSIKSEFLADESQQDWNDIRIKVKGMQISRAKVLSDKFVVSHNVAEPVDFLASVSLALEPVRSKVRYDVSGDLFLMKVNMFQSDVKLLMDIVNLNLQEGAPKSNKSGDTELSPHQIGSMEELSAPDTTDAGSAPTTPYNAVLTFQGLVVQLFEEKEEENQPLKASMLSRFEIGKLVGRINTQTSEDIRSDVNLSLQALSVDDTRPNSTVVNKRIIDCIRETINKEEEELLPLISVIYKERTNGNREADVRMEKITVHIHIPYLQSLYQFFLQALETDTPTNPSPRDSTSVDGEDIIDSPAPEPQPTGMFTLYGTMKQPEFILHGSSGPSDDRILVLEADIEFNMKNDSSEQKIGSKVKDLKMYSSRMGSKATSQHWVIQPCQVDFERSVANNHAHHQVSLAVLEVYVSPQVIRLMFDVSRMLTAEEDTKEEVEDRQEKKSFTNLWSIHQTSAQKWLDKIDPDEPNNPLLPRRAPSETLVVNVEKIDVYFRIRNLDHHVDLLHVFCSLDSTIQDWSKQLHMKADIELKASYFNERLSVWEPLIEPVCETVGVYRPWWAVIKIVKGRSYPMAFNHVQENFNMEDCLRNDVQQLLHRSLNRPSSSESETDESTEMTVLRPKLTGRASRLASERSLESLSHQASIQGESDTEPDGLIQSITNKLGGIFSDDDSSEDADISDTDDNDELFDPSLDKPVFLTPKGPMQAARDRRVTSCPHCLTPPREDQDEVDAPLLISEQDTIEEAEPGEDVPQSYYFIMASQDQLLLNVTPQAINVLTDINKAMTEPETLEMDTINLPALQIFNKLGVNASVTLHPDVKVHSENIKDCSVYKDGENSQPCDADIVDGNGLEVQSETDEADGLISNILGRVGHVAVSAGAYVFDNDEDYLSGQNLSISRFRLHVDGFHLSSTVSHRRARRQLMPLFPHKHKIKYWYLLDIDVWHGRKVINFLSPLQIKNNITRSMDVFCKTKDLKVYLSVESDTEEFSKLVTIETGEVYNVPLFVAYHLELFMCPADSSYKMTRSKIWWKDLVGKEKSRTYSCPVAEADLEPFYFMVVCSKGSKLVPPQTVPAGVPYYQLTLSPPVILHNYLPYNIQYSLEGTQSAFVMLKMGDSSYLHGVDLKESYKLHLQIQDYQSIDWTGVYDITQNLEEFKAVTMAPYDFGFEGNNNKHLTLTVHATQQSVVDLYVYSPYWLVNKTDLVIQVKGSKSEAVFDCQPNRTSPVLFRFKKNRPKKAKIKVFNSRWSQSFSLDTVGNSGVVICNDRERKTKYRLMLQFQWSDLKLTRIVTITPFFLVVNKLSRALRYMEENETTDLWLDIGVGECKPYWPSTSSDKMVIEYSDSNIMSEHFPINTPHNTVLRMENGTAVCVEVSGGLETSRTISFSDYDVGDAPVQVENLCEDIFIVIRQKGQHQMTVLGQNQSILYTWDNPTGNRTLLWNVYNGKKSQESEIDITKDSYNPKRLTVKLVQSSSTYNYHDVTDGPVDSSPEDETDPGEEEEEGGDSVDGVDLRSRLKTKAYKMTIYWVSFLDRQQRVVLFTQDPRVAEAARMMYEGEHVTWFSLISLDGIALSVINEVYEEVALVSLTCLPASWEIEVKNKWKMLEDITLVTWLEDKWKNGVDQASWDNRIEVDFKNLRMTKPYIGDLRRVAYPGLFFQHRMSQHQTLIHARIYKIQIDNQLLDAYHQTVLSCAPTPAYLVKKKGPKPCIEFGMIRRVVPENNVDTFRQFQVILQELRLAVDWGFIESIQDTFADLMPTEATESAKLQSDVVVTQRPLQEVADVMVEKRPHRIFFEMFKISPVKVHVSFSLRGNPHLTRDVQPSVASDIKEFLRNSIGATFTEVKDIELKLGFFERRGALLSSAQMQTQAIAHYRQQLMLQIYVVIFGLDVLGNPYGLIKDIAEGLGELFYEPLLDTIQGEEAFSSNMVRGFQNAMGHIVGGTANSVARISGTLGNTLAYLSMDDEFQKRRVRRLQQQPRNLPHSMGMAGRGFLSGMKFGLLGVVLDPIHGASEEGVEGFFKGIGKGLLGLITQPLGGVMDMVSLAFDGLRRSAENDVVAIRMRLPRFINPYHGLEPYSWYRAQGNFILHSLRDEQHNSRVFVDFAPLSYDDRADLIFITIGTILCLSKNRFSTGYDVKWEVERERIMGIPEVMENKLVLTLKDKKGSLFSGSAIEISSPDDDILKWIQDRMERVVRQYV